VTARVAAVVVAAGEGRRLGGSEPKQFLEVAGRPLLVHALLPFEAHPWVDRIVVVLPPERVEEWSVRLPARYGFHKVCAVVAGGARRRDSVRAGLEAAGAGGWRSGELVAVHDGARPLLETGLLDRLLRAAAVSGAAVPVVLLSDTIVRTAGGEWGEVVDRGDLRRVQTPQVFRAEWLLEAHGLDPGADVSDDAQLVRALGRPVTLVAGDPGNLKVTEARDLELARRWLEGGER
jgi:2-C-methyl-D-erythritol 4-phosphate cytidylyltransferase